MNCTIKTNREKHWLQKLPGMTFRTIYMRHWDNFTCIILAALGLIITALTQYSALYPLSASAVDLNSYASNFKGSLLIFGLFSLIVPAAFALMGRVTICRTARNAIDVAVQSLLETEVNFEMSKFDNEANDKIAESIDKNAG